MLSQNTRAVLDLLVKIQEWEARTVEVLKRKHRLTREQVDKVYTAAHNMTAQARALTDGASNDEARAAILPSLRLEVEVLNTYAGSLREVLMSNI